jgi:hypothetical protein
MKKSASTMALATLALTASTLVLAGHADKDGTACEVSR